MSIRNGISCIAFLLLLSACPEASASDGADWMNEGREDLPKGHVSNDNVMVHKDSSPFSLTVQAQRAMKSDHPEHAIKLCKRAFELDPDCAETHQVYAEALERKLALEKTEDPELFNLCVKEWLAVLRNQYGEEAGTSFHGIALPLAGGKWYEDDDRHRPARQHLIKLTGSQPKIWETNEKFLKRVRRSGETSVSARIIKDENGKPAETTTPAPAATHKQSAKPAAGVQ